MIFTETCLRGTFIIEPEKLDDERGFFARAWCTKEFVARHLMADFVQCNINFSKKKGTLRGLHYQVRPCEEIKLIRCTKGQVYDVIVDLRPTSSTYKQWTGVELTSDNHKMLYVPEGFAHGYVTLADDTEVFYPVTRCYSEEYECGIRFDDPAFGIRWPVDVQVISNKDKGWLNYSSYPSNKHPLPSLR